MISLPFSPTGKWSIKHAQPFLADLINTRAMDFNRTGFASMSGKPVCLYNENTDAEFGTVLAIVPISTGSSTTHYFITDEKQFSWDASTASLTKLTGLAPTGYLGSDGATYLGILVVSTVSKIVTLDGSGTWVDRVTGLTTTNPHPVCVFENRRTLCWADGNIVYQSNAAAYTDDSVNRLTIPPEYTITGMRWRQNKLYVATRSTGAGGAKMFVWNGAGATAEAAWDAQADWIYSLVDYKSSICILNSAGQLRRFNGGGFDDLAAFPVYYSPYSWNTDAAIFNISGRCANRGMIAHGDILYINIDGGLNTSLTDGVGRFLHDQPSGLWVYDPDSGLSHRGGYLYNRYNETTYTLASSILTFAAAHNLKTGDPVYATDITGVTGLIAGQMYYAVVHSATGVWLAYSRAEALAGRTMTITGTTTASTKVIIDTFDSMGAVYTQTFPGAVGLFITDNPPAILGGEVMYAGDVTTSDGTTSISSLMSFGASHGVSSFTTSPLPGSGATEAFAAILAFIHGLDLDDAQVVIKYRTLPRYGFPTQYHKAVAGLAIWTTASTFTVDTTQKDFRGAIVGDEIEIIEGAGAGYTAHITSLDDTTSTFTVGIDETIPGITAGMKSEVMADNWQRLLSITNASDDIAQQFARVTIPDGVHGPYIEFKVEMRGIRVAIRRLSSVSSPARGV